MGMPRYKNIVSVDKTSEKRMYQIMSELKLYGESVVDSDNKEWHGTMRKFGIRTKPLVSKGLIDPVWIRLSPHKTVEKRLIKLPKNVCVEEITHKNKSIFQFSWRKK